MDPNGGHNKVSYHSFVLFVCLYIYIYKSCSLVASNTNLSIMARNRKKIQLSNFGVDIKRVLNRRKMNAMSNHFCVISCTQSINACNNNIIVNFLGRNAKCTHYYIHYFVDTNQCMSLSIIA